MPPSGRSDSREEVAAIARRFGERPVDLDDLIAAYRVETGMTLNWYFVEATLKERGWIGVGGGRMTATPNASIKSAALAGDD